MSEDKLDHAFATVDPSRRAFVKKLVVGSSFAVPIVASYSMTDLAYAQIAVATSTAHTTTE